MRRKNEHGVSVMGEVLRLHRVVVQLFPIRGQHVSNPIRARLEKWMEWPSGAHSLAWIRARGAKNPCLGFDG